MKQLGPFRLLISCIVIAILTLVASIYLYFNRSFLHSFDNASVMLVFCVCIIFMLLFLAVLFLYFYIDNSSHKHDEHLRLEKQRYKALVEYSHWNVWEYNFATDTISSDTVNNFKPTDFETFKSRALDHKLCFSEDISVLSQCLTDLKNGKKDVYAEFRLRYATKDFQWFELTGTTIYDNHNKPLTAIAKTVNVDRRKKEIEELRYTTERDPLTNLYNFATIRSKLNDIISYNEGRNILDGILIIDIDNFESIWDCMGHSFSNAVLIDFANKLNKRIGDNSLAGYIACNRFVVILKDIESVDYTEKIAQNISHIFKELYLGDQNDLSITCSIGISIFPLDGTLGDELLENADIALFMAKKSGKNSIRSYEKPYRSIINMSEYLTKSIKSSTLKPIQESHSIIDSDLIFNVVDILFESKELEAAINVVLSLIGNYYSIDQLGIYELTNSSTLTMTYEWHNSSFAPFCDKLTSIDRNDAEKFALYKSSNTGIYSTDSANKIELRPSAYKDLINESSLKCIYQCGISDKGDYVGYFYSHSLSQRDDWSTNIIDSLTLLAKIMGGYLIKHRSTQNMDRLLQYDALTGADNLKTFSSHVSELLTNNLKNKYVMTYLDIDKFKYINETYGYATGDFILKEFASKIRNTLDSDETFGRVVDDKFLILVKYTTHEELKKRMSNFKNIISTIRMDESDNYNLTLTAGLYLITKYENVSLIIDRANIARKSIKDLHRSSYAFFNENMRNQILKQKELENIMDSALNNNEFCVYLQPKYNISTNEVCGAEALVRWNRPDYGVVPPSEFIPFFEENSFIIEIDYYIFDKTCEMIKNMLDSNIKPVPVSINFSRIHLNNNKILEKLKHTLDKYHLTADYLEIEITESACSTDDKHMLSILKEIQKLGFRLSMDDFGSGLSSLNSLRKLPFDILKLDKDFFQGDYITERERVVISNIVRLAKELHMDIVAEGVETTEQTQFLKEIDCPVIQGYIFSKPIPKETFLDRYFYSAI